MEHPNVPALQKYGLKILKEYDLFKTRKAFTYDFELSDDNIIKFLKETLDIPDISDKFEIIRKTFNTDDNLKFHIDDCQIVKIKTPPTYNIDKYIHLEGNKYFFFKNKFNCLPKLTILFYSSDYGVDFTGGILTLADGVEIIAKKNTGFMLDSREAHMVTPVKSGERKTTLVKIY